MARSRAVVAVKTPEQEFREIIDWYQDQLERTAPPSGLLWTPVTVGPTWRYESGWVLPTYTLGWRVLAWCGKWLRDDRGNPWRFTLEQARFILWYFAIRESGFEYHSAVLQRLKGWGKDPIAATLAIAGMFAEVRFAGWDGDIPLGAEEASAWVQVFAVSQDQTKNTMKLFPSLISAEARAFYGIQVGKLHVYGLNDTRTIEAMTAGFRSQEGGRPTFVIRNETQWWIEANGGHDLADSIDGNAAKSPDGAARMLDICNAYRDGEDSVAERTRLAWEKTQGPEAEYREFGLMYDSLEAPPEAPLTAEEAPTVVEAIRGDSVWLSPARIVQDILNPKHSAAESRRKWYNQISAAANARFDPLKVRAAFVPEALSPDDEVVIFGDGSKSDDATGLVACRISDGLCQVLHVQQPRKGELVNRAKTDDAVADAFETYRVRALWFDPSHAKDDDAEGDERFWWPYCDEWMARHGRQLKLWAVKTGDRRHAVAFDMSNALSPRYQLYVAAVERMDEDLNAGNVKLAPSGWLRAHLLNARQDPTRWGLGMNKSNRESAKKIDLAVCAVGARMLRRQYQLSLVGTKGAPGKGRVITM